MSEPNPQDVIHAPMQGDICAYPCGHARGRHYFHREPKGCTSCSCMEFTLGSPAEPPTCNCGHPEIIHSHNDGCAVCGNCYRFHNRRSIMTASEILDRREGMKPRLDGKPTIFDRPTRPATLLEGELSDLGDIVTLLEKLPEARIQAILAYCTHIFRRST